MNKLLLCITMLFMVTLSAQENYDDIVSRIEKIESSLNQEKLKLSELHTRKNDNRFKLSVDYLMFNFSDEQAWALSNNIDEGDSSQSSYIHRVEPDRSNNVRYNLTYTFENDYDLRLSYLHITGSGRDSFVDLDGETGVMTHPDGATDVDEDDTHAGNSSLRISIKDLSLDFGKRIYVNKNLTMRPFVGFEYLKIKRTHSMNWTERNYNEYEGPGPQPGPNPEDLYEDDEIGSYYSELKIRGLGFRLGTDFDYYIGKGFSVIGETSVSILKGDMNYEQGEYDDDGDQAYLIKSSSNEIFYKTNVMLGINYEHQFEKSKATIAVGYEILSYYGLDVPYASDDVNEQNFVDRDLDMDMSGLFIRFGYEF